MKDKKSIRELILKIVHVISYIFSACFVGIVILTCCYSCGTFNKDDSTAITQKQVKSEIKKAQLNVGDSISFYCYKDTNYLSRLDLSKFGAGTGISVNSVLLDVDVCMGFIDSSAPFHYDHFNESCFLTITYTYNSNTGNLTFSTSILTSANNTYVLHNSFTFNLQNGIISNWILEGESSINDYEFYFLRINRFSNPSSLSSFNAILTVLGRFTCDELDYTGYISSNFNPTYAFTNYNSYFIDNYETMLDYAIYQPIVYKGTLYIGVMPSMFKLARASLSDAGVIQPFSSNKYYVSGVSLIPFDISNGYVEIWSVQTQEDSNYGTIPYFNLRGNYVGGFSYLYFYNFYQNPSRFVRNLDYMNSTNTSANIDIYVEATDLLSTAFNGMNGLFTIAILPSLTLGTLVFLPLVVGLILTLIKLITR